MQFSIVIPAYNAEGFIVRSISSVLKQTFTDYEVIVVNDGSKDKTLEYAKSIDDERLTVIDKINEGVSEARNAGIRQAKGDYICFLDADDEYLPEHLSVLAEAIEKYTDKGFFATQFCISMMDDSSKVIMPKTSGNTVYYENAVEEVLRSSEFIWTGCVCIKKELFSKYGMFEPGVKIGEDVDMWKRVYVHTGVVYSDVVTVRRNRDGSAATKSYQRTFEVDMLNRMPLFLSDDTISESVKKSLRIEHELSKLSVVRSFLYVGEKKKARELLKQIDKTKISKKRLYATRLCFFVPSALIRWYINFKNKGLYE